MPAETGASRVAHRRSPYYLPGAPMVGENLAAQTTASAASGGSRVGATATQRGRWMVVADLNPDDDFDCRDQQLPRPGATGSAAAPAFRWTCAGRARPLRSR